ncbi:MAG: flagellar hook-length control protein FliK [Lachnospiraceae bacterium]|nr:flagellar hook-length control protein FliK [Lachnospiraceae bacterium]
MTAGLVTQVNPMKDFIPGQVSQTNDAAGNFSDVLKMSTDKGADTQTGSADAKQEKQGAKVEGTEKDRPVETENNVTKETDDNAGTDKVASKEENVEENTDEIIKENLEAIAEAVTTVVSLISEVFGVEEAEVSGALETLELTDIDLLDATNIPAVAVELTDADDTMDIMTDENLFAAVKQVTEGVNETVEALTEEIGVAEEDIKTYVQETRTEVTTVKAGPETEEVQVTTGIPAPVQKPQTEEREESTGQNGAQMNFSQQFVENVKAQAAERAADEPVSYTTSMDDIYTQVSESLKLNLQEDVTEMEMNLHPASLGNVRVQVAARDGVITANFITQNETVRAAIESQIVELKNNMNEQGIKVEAIEVTLASHAFEDNLNRGNDRAGESSEGETRKRRRNINLNEIDDTDDNIVEDEIRIAREMMMHNGTTVDYMA